MYFLKFLNSEEQFFFIHFNHNKCQKEKKSIPRFIKNASKSQKKSINGLRKLLIAKQYRNNNNCQAYV